MGVEASVRRYMSLGYQERVTQDVDEDGSPYYVARVVELPGCVSDGATPEEAVWNLQDAKRLCLEVLLDKGIAPPAPQKSAVQRVTWVGGQSRFAVSCPLPSSSADRPIELGNVAYRSERRVASDAADAKWAVRKLLSAR